MYMYDDRQFPFPFFPNVPSQGQGGQLFPFPQFPGGQGNQMGPGSQAGAPTSPPPSFTPQQSSAQVFAVDPGSIRGCLFRFTYIWLRGFESFWFFPTFVGRRSVSGFRWTGFRWVYFGVDLRRIESFQCY